jgi:GTP-binding protein EngB required for normal cell division
VPPVIAGSASSTMSAAPADDTKGAAEAAAAGRRDGVKIILLGDSAVGKSKLVERFLMDG